MPHDFKHYLFDWGDTLMVDFPSEAGPMYQWSEVQAVDGAIKLLESLSQTANCYLATNAKDSTLEDIKKALVRVGLDQYITQIFCFRSIGFEKPSSEFFQKILKELNAEKGEVVMIGDDLTKDVKGAEAFGIQGIWLNSKKEVSQPGVWEIHRLLELMV